MPIHAVAGHLVSTTGTVLARAMQAVWATSGLWSL